MSDLPLPSKSPVAIVCQLGGGAATIACDGDGSPFISQIAASPFCGSAGFNALLYCHKMSASPSSLKSPVVTACQPGGGAATIACEGEENPFISQIAASPFCGSGELTALSYCHSKSDLPSPL